MLGHLAEGKYVMAVAGTHGKTTTSTLVAWLNRALTGGGSAFLGGISKNFGGNLVLDGCGVQGMRPPAGEGRAAAGSRLSGGGWPSRPTSSTVRSCGSYPDVAVVTSADADHLDIYGTHEAVKEAFAQFVRQIRPRVPRHQARDGHRGGQSADYGVPLFVRRAVRLLCP